MGNVLFYLKKPAPGSNRALIILQYEYNGRKVTFSTGHFVNPKYWGKDKRVKNNEATRMSGEAELNDLMDNLRRELTAAHLREAKNGIPEPSTLKAHLTAFLNRQKGIAEQEANRPTLYQLIEKFVAGEIRHEGQDKGASTLKRYNTVYNHLKDFEKKAKYRVDYDTINLEFVGKYLTYLKDLPVKVTDRAGKTTTRKGLKQNSIAKDFAVIKTFMNEAVERGETDNLAFKKKGFRVATEETDAVYLSEAELLQLYRHDFTGNKRLDQVRDLFIFGAYVGLRFSDYSAVKPENIVTIDGAQFIKILTKKTRELVVIPCHPIIKEIFAKYHDSPNRLPKSLSNQKFNAYIKEACEAAGLTETGRLSTAPELPLCDCVSSHTCRRSFATNYYLQGFPTIDLMKITGHRTEGAFLRYIKVSKLDAAKRLAAHMQNRWENKLIKVA